MKKRRFTPSKWLRKVWPVQLFGLFVNLWKFNCSVFGGPWIKDDMDSFFHQNRLNHALKKWSTHTLQWVANWEIQLAHERKTFKITWNNNREFNLLTVKFNVIKNEIKSIHSVCTENFCARGHSFYSGKCCHGGVFSTAFYSGFRTRKISVFSSHQMTKVRYLPDFYMNWNCFLFRIFVENLFWPITWLISNWLVQFSSKLSS